MGAVKKGSKASVSRRCPLARCRDCLIVAAIVFACSCVCWHPSLLVPNTRTLTSPAIQCNAKNKPNARTQKTYDPNNQLIAGLAFGGLYGGSVYLINNGKADSGFALGFASSMMLVRHTERDRDVVQGCWSWARVGRGRAEAPERVRKSCWRGAGERPERTPCALRPSRLPHRCD